MSTLKLMILLHYYGHADDFNDGDWSAPAVGDAINWAVDEGLISAEEGSAYAQYGPTDRLKAYARALKLVPLPVQVWVIPDA